MSGIARRLFIDLYPVYRIIKSNANLAIHPPETLPGIIMSSKFPSILIRPHFDGIRQIYHNTFKNKLINLLCFNDLFCFHL